MNQKEKDIRFIKKGKLIVMLFGLLSIMNIIILIGKNSSYALFRRTVQSKRVIEIHTASKFPPEIGVDALKKKLGKGGLIGVTEDNKPTIDKEASNIREYRYSGLNVNNYVYFNCKEGVEQNSDNCETWRIIGIFKDEFGQEHLKIVRNEMLPASIIPDIYTVNENNYNIKYSSGDYAYFDYDGSNYDNDWATSGLMYWLNSKGTTNGYLQNLTFETQNMIVDTKYYLGNVWWDDTAVQAYADERKNTRCSSDVVNSSHNSNCYIWSNNQEIWTGKIGLMYTSDYGFSTDSSYWNTKRLSADYISFIDSSWLYKTANHTYNEWFISPSSHLPDSLSGWYDDGHLGGRWTNLDGGVRPVIYLKFDVEIVAGKGISSDPYQLNYRAVDALKEKLGTGGIIGVKEDNTPTISKNDIVREYRYSGLTVNNYVYFNCQEGKEQTADTCETWRIIGIFKDESGLEHLKIVRNEILPASIIPDIYTVNENNYNIKFSSGDYAYFDYDGSNYDNNWADSGLMRWLNSKGTTNGYLKNLKSETQKMIVGTKYYLGNVTSNSTAIQTYADERKNIKCGSDVSIYSQNSNCYIWANNQETWIGKIALIYPSDMGFSSDSSNWNTKRLYADYSIFIDSSWLYKDGNHIYHEWLLSPSSHLPNSVSGWYQDSTVGGRYTNLDGGIRPALYLKSNITITGGEGTSSQPYKLKLS